MINKISITLDQGKNRRDVSKFEDENFTFQLVETFEDEETFKPLPDHQNAIFDLKICSKQNTFAVSRTMG